MRDINKMQKQVHFITAPVFDSEDVSGNNNKWNYNRAVDGYVFKLHSAQISVGTESSRYSGIVMIFDGHEYTHWNIWPGVESRELLTRTEFHSYNSQYVRSLNNWECKEYSIGIRSTSADFTFKVCIIVWYYLQKMSYLETLYYAVIQPRWKRFKKAFRTTLDPRDE